MYIGNIISKEKLEMDSPDLSLAISKPMIKAIKE